MIRRSGQKALSASHFNGAALRQRVDDDDDDQHRAGDGVVVKKGKKSFIKVQA